MAVARGQRNQGWRARNPGHGPRWVAYPGPIKIQTGCTAVTAKGLESYATYNVLKLILKNDKIAYKTQRQIQRYPMITISYYDIVYDIVYDIP